MGEQVKELTSSVGGERLRSSQIIFKQKARGEKDASRVCVLPARGAASGPVPPPHRAPPAPSSPPSPSPEAGQAPTALKCCHAPGAAEDTGREEKRKRGRRRKTEEAQQGAQTVDGGSQQQLVLLRRKRVGRLRHEMGAKCTITRKEGKNILRLKKIIASLRSTREEKLKWNQRQPCCNRGAGEKQAEQLMTPQYNLQQKSTESSREALSSSGAQRVQSTIFNAQRSGPDQARTGTQAHHR
ncbi:hypothetical protein EYF80_031300 [Liparis tanakae]|uniref:Uncharacterized protein n=1 Tax=Liparis tanakae TaxID=230148 RepID=A0A4Z2GXW7_9TELE|nr:hypothetical protein EYF80_031300 [Liparis tanakae]